MPGGRPPKPNELKRKLGNPGKRPLPVPRSGASITVLPAQNGVPETPSGLKRRGREAWERYWSLGSAWLSPTTDLEIVSRLCRAYDEIEEVRRELRKKDQKRVITTGKGAVVTNPLITQLRKLEELVTRYEGLCGFTPSDRSRLGLAEVQRVSKLDAFLSRRSGRASGD